MDKQKTGELIRNARIKKGYTQVELGDLIGVTNKAISRWEKGDSFPDISVIEELSRVLDIRIQDIVIGDVTEPDSETAVTEVVRAAKLQDKVKKRKFISSVVSCIAAGYMIVCGWYSFRGHIDSSGMYYLGISLAVILVAVFLKERLIGADPNRENADKRIYNIIGFGSMAYSFIMMIIVTGIFNNHEMQSWKIDGNIGRIINVQLIIIFILNLALFIIQNYVSMRKYERETGRAYSLIGACFTSMMYSWLLHTLIDIHSFNKYMIIIAAIVIIELLAIYIIRFCVTNHR
jgi:transcriptional regulator with XRE-family HTH domain